ncbi:MAG: hypothetical protein IKP65_05335 [Alphaproteobacteria bacterium]|nr:hypothetical protein [Alphaproteobacteria bacterium]
MNTYKDIKLIGLAGVSGSGKDTLAELVKNEYERMAFADSLKNICIEYLGLSYDDAYTQEGKKKFNNFWGMTNREILQKIGTDAMRNGFHNEVWTKMLELKIIKALKENKKIIITDCRFDNEAALVEKLGGIVMKIERKNMESNLNESEKNHVSEKGLEEKYISSIILNDRDISNLKNEFHNKLEMFTMKHSDIINVLENLQQNNHINAELTEKIILMIKKYLSYKINAAFPVGDNYNVRLEWNNIKNKYECFLITDKENVTFNAIERNNADHVSYKETFLLNDDEGWKKINQWFNLK